MVAVAVAIDDELVGGGLEPIYSGLCEERVGYEREPLVGTGSRLEVTIIDALRSTRGRLANLRVVAVVERGSS